MKLEDKHKEFYGWTPKREAFGCKTEQYKMALAESVKGNSNLFDVLEIMFGITQESMHQRDGKAVFEIDVIESMRSSMTKNENLSSDEIEDILKKLNPFKVTYTLTKQNGNVRYEIKDTDGNKHGCNEYNAYENTIFGSCQDYFSYCLFYMEEPKEKPLGIVNVVFEVDINDTNKRSFITFGNQTFQYKNGNMS